jgi:UDP-N-acetylmuramate dehydrogenase
MTWFKLGGPADWVVRPKSIDQLADVLRRARENDIETRILGLGANLLIADEGVAGIVLRLDAEPFKTVRFEGGTVIAGGGADMFRLTLECARGGLAGLERMAGIPGTLGGGIRMNAGGRYGEIGELVESITVIDKSGHIETLDRDQIGFAYRQTNLADRIVVEARLALRKDDPVVVKKRYDEIWKYKTGSQPLNLNSAGCIFKNPPNASAGALIEQAGLKGATQGGAKVSDRHGNFLVADEDASTCDVLALIGRVRSAVKDRFNVELDLEVEIWNRRGGESTDPTQLLECSA